MPFNPEEVFEVLYTKTREDRKTSKGQNLTLFSADIDRWGFKEEIQKKAAASETTLDMLLNFILSSWIMHYFKHRNFDVSEFEQELRAELEKIEVPPQSTRELTP